MITFNFFIYVYYVGVSKDGDMSWFYVISVEFPLRGFAMILCGQMHYFWGFDIEFLFICDGKIKWITLNVDIVIE